MYFDRKHSALPSCEFWLWLDLAVAQEDQKMAFLGIFDSLIPLMWLSNSEMLNPSYMGRVRHLHVKFGIDSTDIAKFGNDTTDPA